MEFALFEVFPKQYILCNAHQLNNVFGNSFTRNKKLGEFFAIKKKNPTIAPFEHNETPQSTLGIYN